MTVVYILISDNSYLKKCIVGVEKKKSVPVFGRLVDEFGRAKGDGVGGPI